jgi:hypothetical protein
MFRPIVHTWQWPNNHLDVYQDAYSSWSWSASIPTHWQRPKRLTAVVMKICIFWDTMSYSPLKQRLCLLPCSRWFLAWSVLRPWRRRWHISPKRRSTSNDLHDVISQKTELFQDRKVWRGRESRPSIRGGTTGQPTLRLKSGPESQEGLFTKTEGLMGVNRNVIRILASMYECNCQHMNFNNLFSSDYKLVAVDITDTWAYRHIWRVLNEKLQKNIFNCFRHVLLAGSPRADNISRTVKLYFVEINSGYSH